MPHFLLLYHTVNTLPFVTAVPGSGTTTKLSSCIIEGHKPILEVTAAEHGVSPDRLNRKTQRKYTACLLVISQRGNSITTRCQHDKEKQCWYFKSPLSSPLPDKDNVKTYPAKDLLGVEGMGKVAYYQFFYVPHKECENGICHSE